MAQSPLRRNRAFERVAIPVLLVLLVVVLGRQLRAAVSSSDRCDRVERMVHVERHADRHVDVVPFELGHDVDIDLDGRRVEVRIES